MAYIDIDISECDFTDAELIDEMESRGFSVIPTNGPTRTQSGVVNVTSICSALLAAGYPNWLIEIIRDNEQCPWLVSQQDVMAGV